jgi:glycosyltransferase involved in cell wall biosynthesis
MRIGIDARELSGRATGVGRHLAGLLKAWAADTSLRQHEFVLFGHERIAATLPSTTATHLVPGSGGTAWEQTALPRHAAQERLDVFFAPGYTAPLALRVPTVVLVHDLSFDTHPEWFRGREGMRRRLLTRWSSQKAALTLTVSETIREEVLERYALRPQKVRCIYPGITSLGPAAPQAPRAPLVLFVGSIFNRRNLPDLIKAFTIVSRRHPDARLEIVGDNRTHPHVDLKGLVRSLALEARTAIHPFLPDADLAERYTSAGVFAFLSDYEGFGHPPLEALSYGVPIVVLSTPVAHEVYGPAARYVERGNIDDLARQLECLLFDVRARSEVLDQAPGVLQRYSWNRAGRETMDALEAAVSPAR